MSSFVTVAYRLGCECAAEVFEKQASVPGQTARTVTRAATRKGARRGAKAVTEAAAAPAAAEATAAPGAAQGLWDQFLGSRGAQYAAGGLGGAGLGALAGGEDNRLRGAMMGAGLGLGAIGGARVGEGAGKLRALNKAEGPLTEQALTQAGRTGAGVGLGVGGLGGLVAGRGLAPGHQAPEKSWLERARTLLPPF